MIWRLRLLTARWLLKRVPEGQVLYVRAGVLHARKQAAPAQADVAETWEADADVLIGANGGKRVHVEYGRGIQR